MDSFKTNKNHLPTEKIVKELDREFLECILRFCIIGENILMYDLVEILVKHIFDQVFLITDELLEEAHREFHEGQPEDGNFEEGKVQCDEIEQME